MLRFTTNPGAAASPPCLQLCKVGSVALVASLERDELRSLLVARSIETAELGLLGLELGGMANAERFCLPGEVVLLCNRESIRSYNLCSSFGSRRVLLLTDR